uniref:PH domain-containing protein n=1 Tax=Mesocestoides corti TaxID=53468 RepID=A0A5K3ETK1_MESCO
KNTHTSFLLRENRGRTYHLKALTEQDKNRWIAVLLSAKSKLGHQVNGLESDSCSDDLNSYTAPRRSIGSGKMTQNSNSSSWRSFRPFRRRTRQLTSIASTANDATAATTNTPKRTSMGSMTAQSTSPFMDKEASVSAGPELSAVNGSRATENTDKGAGIFPEESAPTSHSVTYSPYRRRSTLNYGLTGELRVTREFQRHLSALDAAFDNMVIQANHALGLIGDILAHSDGETGKQAVTVSHDSLSGLQSSIDALVEACQKTMAAWTTSMEWFHRRLASEYDKGSRLERTIEQLAKQHRALEMQLYSSYASLGSNRLNSPLPTDHSFYRDAARRMHSCSSMDEVFYDAESCIFQSPGRSDGSGDCGDSDTMLQPSCASLGSLKNVDESSGSEEDDVVAATSKEGLFTMPSGRPSFTAGPPTPTASSNGIVEAVNDPDEKQQDNNVVSGKVTSKEVASSSQAGQVDNASVAPRTSTRQRRTSIPPRPRISLNLWGVLKNCIGKELSRIPLPVNFNEPLSFLQRVTEDLTYSKCIDQAAQVSETNAVERMAWIAAFSVSCYATTAFRLSKPFNPLLGETYECDRTDDYGWRSFAEQVSHHPPVVAHYCESSRYGWKFWQEFTVNSKFRGKYLSLIPKGSTHLVFKDGQHYTWSKVTITVHNIIVGRLWAEIHGETTIKNHTTNHTCQMHYEAHSYFSREADRQVTGCIYDPSGKLVYKVSGTWDSQVEGCAVSPDGQPTGSPTTLLVLEPPPANAESMYNFNQFAMELNELEPGVAPTDSRLRPDQRLMELGRWDEANVEKERLEVKQRRKRKAWDLFEAGKEPINPEFGPPYTPVWFSPIHDEYTDEDCHEFNGTYWAAKAKQDWSKCPDIF